MPRAAKSADAITGHRTKDEMENRKTAEKAALTGKKLKEAKETKENQDAHEEWKRVSRLMTTLNKNDAIFSAVINRYCQLFGEIQACLRQKAEVQKLFEKTEAAFETAMDEYNESDAVKQLISFTKQINDLLKQLAAIDGSIMAKRRMRMEIEKENAMTVASSLRTLPRTSAVPKTDNPLMGVLAGDD